MKAFPSLLNALIPQQLQELKSPPKELFYQGNLELLELRKIAIVGTRKPNPYTRLFTHTLAKLIVQSQGVVVSGGALGVDIIAHQGALPQTIMISPSSLESIYPRSNAKTIAKIQEQGLILSEYSNNPSPKPYHFLERNRLVIALSEAVIIPQADLQSGSTASANIALSLNKPLFVLPHRIGESQGTNALLESGKAQAIYDPKSWVKEYFGAEISESFDEVLKFCATNPSYEEAHQRFGDKLYEYELEGKIGRKNGVFYVCE